jgi:hypothetical protein
MRYIPEMVGGELRSLITAPHCGERGRSEGQFRRSPV